MAEENWASILKRKWKRFLRVGLEGSEVDVALRAARKRILLSDLPPSAINELQKSIDALAASGRSDADLIQVANTLFVSLNQQITSLTKQTFQL